ncbi:MAG TPA: hypothetical protein VHO72_08225, partial [Bacteroidales bacterium]|nr:hypothetical protein [Bacteroidales bacterium]
MPLSLALILAISMTFNGYQFFIDDTTYAAYAMNWQHSMHLGFNNIVHHTTAIEHSRFWLALYPMGQTLLSDLSGVPVILVFSNYLELFLVPLAVITAYWFTRVLGLSQKIAGAAVFIQMLLYTMMVDEAWPVGFWFFQNMAEDKVSATFLLAPVFFAFVLVFLRSPTVRAGALVLIAGVGLMLTHPVILFLSCAIAGGLAVLSVLLKKTGWLSVLQLAAIIVVILLPYLGVRLSNHASQALITYDAESVSTTFQAERYVHVVSHRFYGLNPEVLKLLNIPPESNFYSSFQIFRLVPVTLVLLALILAFLKLRSGELYWGYIIICALLVAFATIPYTGWILGYFISARMLPRVSWFSPMGLAGALLITFLLEGMKLIKAREKLVKSPEKNPRQLDSTTKGFMVELMFAAIMLVSVLFPRAEAYFEVLDSNQQLARVGQYIDQSAETFATTIALDYTTIQLLPSVSAQASLISFREEKDYNPHNYFLSIDQIHERMDASNTIRSLEASIPADERCRLLEKYHVEFVLT